MRGRPSLPARSSGNTRPTVLLADDHAAVLERVSELLAPDFDVAAVATDGAQALDAARRVDPDVIILDIAMPGLDGFETARALKESGSRAPVVFLSMHDADEYVAEAFNLGGRGYVVKTRVQADLPSALHHVLAGRQFLPSLTSLFKTAGDRGHAMHIHGDEGAFLNGLAAFFDLALRRGDATCVIGTEPVREGLAERLRVRGWDVGGSSGHPRCLVIDAQSAVNRFMRDGRPDAGCIAEMAAELDAYRDAVAESPEQRLTIFGNMVLSLCASDNAAAATALESSWNRLTSHLPFFTLCGYTAACFEGDARADHFGDICAEHAAVSHAREL